MISILTPDGSKQLFLRGVLLSDGAKGITQGSITAPAGDRQFWVHASAIADGGGMTAAASPAMVTGALASPSTVTVTTAATTIAVAGGTPPYGYSWSGTGGWTIASPTSASTTFRIPLAPITSADGEFVCTVTDARGATATVNVDAEANNYGGIA